MKVLLLSSILIAYIMTSENQNSTTCPEGYQKVYGSSGKDGLGKFTQVYFFEDCHNICEFIANCNGFEYSKEYQHCILQEILPSYFASSWEDQVNCYRNDEASKPEYKSFQDKDFSEKSFGEKVGTVFLTIQKHIQENSN